MYSFKRDIYAQVLEALEDCHVVVLLGPRCSGKTVCMMQISQSEKNAVYVSFKELNAKKSEQQLDSIIRDISEGRDVLYLLDEITYAHEPDAAMSKIGRVLSTTPYVRTRLVLAGSQSAALAQWTSRAFSSDVRRLKVDFLSYAEYLRYTDGEPSDESYQAFVTHTRDFYGFTGLNDYLQGCLDETVISNSHAIDVIIGNNVDGLTVESLVCVLYATLFSGHNIVTEERFKRSDAVIDEIGHFFGDAYREAGRGEIARKFYEIMSGRLEYLTELDGYVINRAVVFLKRCDLISITPVSDNSFKIRDIESRIVSGEQRIWKKGLPPDLNICMRYPMFYLEIIREILGPHMPEKLPRGLLGSVMECHVRGLLPAYGSYEFHETVRNADGSESEAEIDYVNIGYRMAIEFSVGNKSNSRLHFDRLRSDYRRLLLTRDPCTEKNRFRGKVLRMPYYAFIADGCDLEGLRAVFWDREDRGTQLDDAMV